MYETSPGDTWRGSFEYYSVSGATQNFLLNRFFNDIYVFYCPFRLVWDEWPEFVSQRITGREENNIPAKVPTFSEPDASAFVDDRRRFFIKQPLVEDGGVFEYNALPF